MNATAGESRIGRLREEQGFQREDAFHGLNRGRGDLGRHRERPPHLLLMAQEMSGAEIARQTGYTVVQVSRIRRFAERGMAGLQDQPRTGRPSTVTARKTARIVALTLKAPPPGLTHWSSRDLADTVGVSHTTMHRIWRAHAVRPHRVETFKSSTDPDAEAKIDDVVGLYLRPPTNAVVLSLDEKT